MRFPNRELELDETRLTLLSVVAVLLFAGVFCLGARIGWRVAAKETPGETAPHEIDGGLPARPVGGTLPIGFMGPPGPPYPPPFGGEIGAKSSAGQTLFAVRIETYRQRDQADTRRQSLLAQGLPAYLADRAVGDQELRVGNYATEAEAEAVRVRLRDESGMESQLISID